MTKQARTYVKEMLAGEGAGAFTVGKPLTFERLSICPVLCTVKSKVGYLTYEEALEEGAISVTEVGEHGTVPKLRLENKCDERVLVIDGEQVIGAKQNRILNTTILVEAMSTLIIPVSCVEQGRWHYTGEKEMGSSRAPLYAKTRAMKSRQVVNSLGMDMGYHADQSFIWHDISERLALNNISSPSAAMEHHYAANAEILGKYQDFFAIDKFAEYKAGAMVGAVFALSGKILGMDAFDKTETLGKRWEQLLNSYAIEAERAEGNGELDPKSARAFLRKAGEAGMKTFEPPGLGRDVRIVDEEVIGSALVFDGDVIHLYAFDTGRADGSRGKTYSTGT